MELDQERRRLSRRESDDLYRVVLCYSLCHRRDQPDPNVFPPSHRSTAPFPLISLFRSRPRTPPPPPPPPPATPASARLKNRSQPLSCFILWRRSRTRPPRTPRRPDRAEGQLAGRSSLSAAALPTTDADSSGNPAASLHRASLHFHPRLLKVQHRQEHQGTALSRFAISDSESEIR
jgi:hypothetical protein